MSSAQVLIILGVAAVTLLAVAFLRQAGVPAPVVLVVAGLVIGFLPFVPDVSLQPDVVLLGLLPLLVFDAAVTSSPTGFYRDARSIGALAVLLVVATALAVAAVAHWVGHLSWPVSFVLGTAVGPTDAAAATAVARRVGLPRRLLTVLEGEALFNDATALVLYAAAVTAATTGYFSVAHTVGSIAYSVVAGTAIGLAVGIAGRWLRNRIDDPPIEIAGSILLAYVAYLPAEEAHASGVLAAVTAGLYLGWHSSSGAISARSRLVSNAFWETLVFLVNAVLFTLVGLEFHTFRVQARGPLGRLVLAAVAVVLTVIVLRLAWMWASGWVTGVWHHARNGHRHGRWRERFVLGWAGMRGAITLAALLAVPKTTNAGTALAGRNDIIYLGFAVIMATLVGQGMTLPWVVRRVRLPESPSVAEAERRARIELAQVAIERIGAACKRGELPGELADGLTAQYLGRLRSLQTAPDDEDLEAEASATAEIDAALRRDLIALQRRALLDLRDQGRIGVTTLRAIERDLDLEETRLSSA
ncbi:MAG TPA: Na+/H+ antiporter [Acidimicrobiales bacterium]|nr:Na+/H+ antiporter [Acidimicrobiales bacterium]